MVISCESCQSSLAIDQSLIKRIGSKVKCPKCQRVFKVFPPDSANRRKHPRVKTRNLISFFSYDEQGLLTSQGLGKAMDVSKGGIKLETPHPVDSGVISLMAVDVGSKFIEIKGKLVYCQKTGSGMYHSGVKFFGTDNRLNSFVAGLIKEYISRKNNL